MSGAKVRIQVRVDAEVAPWIREATFLAGKSVSAFMADAALSRADEILDAQHVTHLSAEEFDRLVAWLDEPPVVIPALQRAFAAYKSLDLSRDS